MQQVIRKLKSVFRPRPARLTGERLYAGCVTQARLPVFYLDYGVADDIGARFEMLTLHAGLVIHVLKAVAKDDPRFEEAQETAQGLFDAFLLALDSTLREQGVGDLSVPKKMKKLGIVIYTRLKRWDELWADGDAAAQADYAARTVYAGSDYAGTDDPEGAAAAEASDDVSPETRRLAEAFTAYLSAARAALTPAAIMAGQLAWGAPQALEEA